MTSVRSRGLLPLLVCALSASLCIGAAQAQETNVETAAMLGGRIVGAAKACAINSERIRRASDRMLSVVVTKALTPAEKENALAYFTSAQAAGAEQVRSERSRCAGIHVDFSEMEVKLGRAAPDAVAAKRGIPALGVLDSSAVTRRQ
jgi:hypothetical protein